MRLCSLFGGIGGFEVGFSRVGVPTVLSCEIDPAARAILRRHFGDTKRSKDVRTLRGLPDCEIVTAGWPCQDLSQAGKMAGSRGSQSSLVQHVFRLAASKRRKPSFILFENVAFALHLHGGQAIREVVDELERLKYYWAYRVLDTREFGLPQRRRRIFIVGAQDANPLRILFDGEPPEAKERPARSVGFYWTEGNRGIGWAPEAIPPLKGGSGLSIPAPPAIWSRSLRTFFSPGLQDAERMQGFPPRWTILPIDAEYHDRIRWRLIGNAVSVPVAQWIGQRLVQHAAGKLERSVSPKLVTDRRHNIAWGGPGLTRSLAHVEIEGPREAHRTSISDFVFQDAKPLSLRAASGFLTRLIDSSLRTDPQFVSDLTAYCSGLSADKAA